MRSKIRSIDLMSIRNQFLQKNAPHSVSADLKIVFFLSSEQTAQSCLSRMTSRRIQHTIRIDLKHDPVWIPSFPALEREQRFGRTINWRPLLDIRLITPSNHQMKISSKQRISSIRIGIIKFHFSFRGTSISYSKISTQSIPSNHRICLLSFAIIERFDPQKNRTYI